MKRLEYDYVKDYINNTGEELISKEYKNNSTKLEIKCQKCKNNYWMRFGNFTQGQRCKKCSIEKITKRNRLSYNYVSDKFKERNWEFLSKEYKNNNTKLKALCSNKHICYIRFKRFMVGDGCSICSGNKKKTIEEVKEHAIQFGWKCLSNKYEGKDKHLEYECPNKHIRKIAYNAFRSGKRCAICSKKQKKTIDEIKDYVLKFGWKCNSKEYINVMSLLELECPNKHIVNMSASSFINNHNRCAECSGIKKKTLEEVKNITTKLTNGKIECISKKYKNNKQKLKFMCKKGEHTFRRSLNRFMKNQKCMKCIKIKILDKLEDFNHYSYIVRLSTEKNYKKYKNVINKENIRRSNNYHLDHMYSIACGFSEGILPIIISNPNNLRIIKADKNLSKKCKCSITKESLYKNFDDFIIKGKMK